MSNLYAAASANAIMREELLRQFPELGEDDQALADTLEGVSSFRDVVGRVVETMHEDEMLVIGIDHRVNELNARRDRLALRAEKMRAALAQAMERASEKKIVLPEATVSLCAVAGKVIITDDAVLPDDYKVFPDAPPPRPDKLTIARAPKDGAVIPGATLSNGGMTAKIRRT